MQKLSAGVAEGHVSSCVLEPGTAAVDDELSPSLWHALNAWQSTALQIFVNGQLESVALCGPHLLSTSWYWSFIIHFLYY